MKKIFLLLSVLLVLSSQIMQTMLPASSKETLTFQIFDIKKKQKLHLKITIASMENKKITLFQVIWKFYETSKKISKTIKENNTAIQLSNDDLIKWTPHFEESSELGANFFYIKITDKDHELTKTHRNAKQYVRNKYIFFSLITMISLFGLKKYKIAFNLKSSIKIVTCILIIKIAELIRDFSYAPLNTIGRLSNKISSDIISDIYPAGKNTCDREIVKIQVESVT